MNIYGDPRSNYWSNPVRPEGWPWYGEASFDYTNALGRLFGVLVVALVWVIGVGQRRQRVRPEPTASHGRPRRSLFRVGLDGHKDTESGRFEGTTPLLPSFVVYLGRRVLSSVCCRSRPCALNAAGFPLVHEAELT